MTVEQRAEHKGDRTRSALLAAVSDLLATGDFDDVAIADITRRAGVTRSAFYFYFENKAEAVAAACEELSREVFDAAELLVGADDPETRVRATIRSLYESWSRHAPLFRALLEARATSPAVREMWESGRQPFVPPVAAMIEAERAAGRAPDGVDATALATVLLDMNEQMLERLALGTPLEHDQLLDAVTSVWLRSVYGRTDFAFGGARP